MQDRSQTAVLAGTAVLLVVGFGTLTFHVIDAIGQPSESFLEFFLRSLIPLLLSLSLIGAALYLLRSEFDSEYVWVTAQWCIAGVVATTLVGIFVTFLRRQIGITDVFFLVVNIATGGAVIGFLIGVYDAENERSRAELIAERERAARISQRLQVLNRVLRHDIRNDLNVVAGYAELLIEDGADVEQVAAEIKRKSTEMAALSDHARDIENMVRREDTRRRAVDIAEIVRSQVERAERDHVGVTIDTDIPETQWVYASKLVGSAIDNVIENAITHNDQAAVELTVALSETDDGVELRIADNGPGIPDHEIDILETGEETRLQHSSGLGLWLVNWIMRESGGDVRFEENDPRGSVVVLQFPTADAAVEQPAPNPRVLDRLAESATG